MRHDALQLFLFCRERRGEVGFLERVILKSIRIKLQGNNSSTLIINFFLFILIDKKLK
jgi:hypothetical protein